MRLVLPLLTIAGIAACGNGGDGGAAPAPAPAVEESAADTITAAGEPAPEAPQLPADFPSDFPLPPDHVVMEGSVTQDEAGVFASALLAVPAPDVEPSFAWYRQALTDAGWQVAAQGRATDGRTLHATQGESYVDLTVRPDLERPGWVLVEASIWKVAEL